jgi:hypothetical protein
MACDSALAPAQARSSAASSMWAAMNRSICSFGNMRRASRPGVAPPNQRARSPRTVTSWSAVMQTLSCA